MIKSLFEAQRKNIEYFFDNINMEKVEKIFQEIFECRGNIIFSGVGKSGIIANKLAATMLSTGTKSIYISATDALHGDIGIISKEDIFIVLSKSGNTKEILSLLPYVRKKGAKIIALVSNFQGKLYTLADISISLPVKNELCPFNLAPTTSCLVQLIFGDILAVALMRRKNFTLEEYAINHPSGSIGTKIAKIKDRMLRGSAIPFASCKKRIVDILAELSEKRCGAVVIVDENYILQGIFTDGDLRRAIEKSSDCLNQPIDNFMTKKPKYITEEKFVKDGLDLMEKNKIMVLPVVDQNKKVIGLLKMHDIIESDMKNLMLLKEESIVFEGLKSN